MLRCPDCEDSKVFRFYTECVAHVNEKEETLSIGEPEGDPHMVVACDECDYEGSYKEFLCDDES